MIELDHVDIVTTHKCNMKCPFCVDKFRGAYSREVRIIDVIRFINLIREHTDKNLEVLLLGGEPTILPDYLLMAISTAIKTRGFTPIMSTNGIEKEKIISLLPYFKWIQVTCYTDAQIDFWRPYAKGINIKYAGDQLCTYDKLMHFIEVTKDFERRSVSMYSTPDFVECCTDKKIWDLLDTLEWKRNGSYLYAFYEGVRFKKFIKGETNVIDEPSVPKLYPTGVYNKTWCNENYDPYLGELENASIR